MPDAPIPQSPNKSAVAVLKGGPEFQVWFKRLQDRTRLPATLPLDAALVTYDKSLGFEGPIPTFAQLSIRNYCVGRQFWERAT